MGKAAAVHAEQGLEKRTISGEEYYQLKGFILELKDSGYKEKDFKHNFFEGHGGFVVLFDGTSHQKHMIWKNIVVYNPSTFVFFGPPLDMNCSYDNLFNGTNASNMHKRFLTFYDHFEGDVNACLCLLNS